jgi:hypothetical protein
MNHPHLCGTGQSPDSEWTKIQIAWTEPSTRNIMPLIDLVVALVVLGVGLWLINNYIPMDSTIKKILNVVVVIVVVLWLLSAFGLLGPLSGLRIG